MPLADDALRVSKLSRGAHADPSHGQKIRSGWNRLGSSATRQLDCCGMLATG